MCLVLADTVAESGLMFAQMVNKAGRVRASLLLCACFGAGLAQPVL